MRQLFVKAATCSISQLASIIYKVSFLRKMDFINKTSASFDNDDNISIDTNSLGISDPCLQSNNSSIHEIDADFDEASETKSIHDYIKQVIRSGVEKKSFIVTNLAKIRSQFELWKRELPFVEPFYAIKCCPNSKVVQCLSSLGCGFDCASIGEILQVCKTLKSTQTRQRKIVYAQPAKMEDHLQSALLNGVSLMVFDGEEELYKIADILDAQNEKWLKNQSGKDSVSDCLLMKPQVELLIRITTSDSQSMCKFSHKFGCDANLDGPRLLEIAHRLGLNVVGVSFHVGSGCADAEAYSQAINDAGGLFTCAVRLGMPHMSVLDIGGGFPGDMSMYYNNGKMPSFQELATTIRRAVTAFESRLADASPGWASKVRYIAEPGRFFVSASSTVATHIYSRKTINQQSEPSGQALYVDDGVYGTFNNVVYDHYKPPRPKLLRMGRNLYAKSRAKARSNPAKDQKAGHMGLETSYDNKRAIERVLPTSIFGPTCDGLDQLCSAESCNIHRADVGDWLLWDFMGAYTHTASFVFNGYDHFPNTHVVDLD